MDKRLVLAIWILLGLAFIVIPVLYVITKSIYLFGVDLLLGVSLGLMTIAWSHKKRYEFWKLNKDRRKNPLSWKTRLKRAKKPIIKNSDGKTLSLTGRGEIIFLTILAWLVFEIISIVLKINYITSFEIACSTGFAVLGSLIALYFSRRKRRMMEKFVPLPRHSKAGYAFGAMLIGFIFGYMSLIFILQNIAGSLIGWSVVSGIVGLKFYLEGRKRGYKKFDWNDVASGIGKMKGGAFSRWARNVSKSRKISF